jgi:osomolarity two-component system phosphorelay intermediate protein YPD1
MLQCFLHTMLTRSRESKNLKALSELGHFLKGSSATLGLVKVKDQCEKIQNLGARKDETGTSAQTDDEKSLAKIKEAIGKARTDYEMAKNALSKWYSF